MSVIIAMISKNNGVIASDGRETDTFELKPNDRGVLVADPPPKIKSDGFNKTFSLNEGRVIGAFCGLVEFSKKTIKEHIDDIIQGMITPDLTLRSIIERIETELKLRLDQIDNGEVIRSKRGVDLLIIGREKPKKLNLLLASIRFIAKDANPITIQRNIYSPHDRGSYCQSYGDDLAQKAIKDLIFIHSHDATNNLQHLKDLTLKYLNSGIKKAGIIPYGTHQTCGGNIFMQTI